VPSRDEQTCVVANGSHWWNWLKVVKMIEKMKFIHVPQKNKNLPRIGGFCQLNGRTSSQGNDERKFEIGSVFSLDSDWPCILTL
jgi:hypothetical protein